jgi:succinate dehydrogenase hydrophobic anchor subunit
MTAGQHPVRGAVRQPADDTSLSAASIRRHALSYLLVRMTGILLAILVCGHFIIMHFANDVAATNASFIARRWSHGLWVGWDALMLAAALLHGGIGTSAVLADYTAGRCRRVARGGLAALTAALFAYGALVIVRGAGS